MSTKNLARVPLEAGNTRQYHYVRWVQRRQHRHEAKVFCHRAMVDSQWCEMIPAPVAPERRNRRGLSRSELHADAIGPVRAWIFAQVGRIWDDVYREIRRRFDTRTLAGWHIVEQHLLRSSLLCTYANSVILRLRRGIPLWYCAGFFLLSRVRRSHPFDITSPVSPLATTSSCRRSLARLSE